MYAYEDGLIKLSSEAKGPQKSLNRPSSRVLAHRNGRLTTQVWSSARNTAAVFKMRHTMVNV